MMSVNPYRLKHLANENHKGAIRVSELLKRPDRLIGLILIGNNLVNIAAASVTTLIGQRLYGDIGLVIAPIALTLVVLIFSEVTPKTLAALYPERVAFPASLVLKYLLSRGFDISVESGNDSRHSCSPASRCALHAR